MSPLASNILCRIAAMGYTADELAKHFAADKLAVSRALGELVNAGRVWPRSAGGAVVWEVCDGGATSGVGGAVGDGAAHALAGSGGGHGR